jgi:hypothetical protein
MDSKTLAENLIAFLIPFLPYLLGKVEDAVAEVAVEKSGEVAWEEASPVGRLLRPDTQRRSGRSQGEGTDGQP